MSAPTALDSAPDTPGTDQPGTTAAGPRPRTVWRAVRVPLVVAVVILIGAVVLGLSGSRYNRGSLDPRAVDPQGSRALAQLLTDRGVNVHRVKGGAAVAARADTTSTVFVPYPDYESAQSLAALQNLGTSVRLVVLDPGSDVLSDLTGEVESAKPAKVKDDPNCSESVATTAGDADLGSVRRYRLRHAGTGTLCYGGAVAFVHSRVGGPLVLVASGRPFINDRLGERGNAALALGLLGSSDDLWWVLPDPAAGGAGQSAGLFDVLPGWVGPVLWELALVSVLLALWRGRRLGPVVVEPLPVVVRAAETVEGRARLYQRGRARDSAAQALRDGARNRLVPLLGLGADPSQTAVAEAVAARTGRPAYDVGGLLFGRPPVDDEQLVGLADALDHLVRTTLDSEGPRS
ncbi:MAG: DUF4350 domain-containing protein [Mycobacteriales bacterium]